ncbi:MAG: hypothetical protein IPK17_06755 [Chloroflexi bacterium]|uniref:hypothetical protein n=1 Tax=Candidatus Flexifilum breve TaxID=3140694 RepID=UPI0031374B24|nr:hypothetical protein [Chloroflexota bacterium]
MSTFDRSITIPAPPKVVVKVLWAELGSITENRRKHLLFKALPDGLCAVYYWQRDGRRATYLRLIITPLEDVNAWLGGAPNLIRALDELKLPISDEAKEAGYEQLDAITEAVKRQKTAVEGWLWYVRQRLPVIVAMGIAGLVFGPSLLRQVTSQPYQAAEYTLTLPANWQVDQTPAPMSSCWTDQYVECAVQFRRSGTSVQAAFSRLNVEHLIIYSPESAYEYFWRSLQRHDRDLRILGSLNTFRTLQLAGVSRDGMRYVPVDNRRSFRLFALEIDSTHYVVVYIEGLGYELEAHEAEITQFVNSIQLAPETAS